MRPIKIATINVKALTVEKEITLRNQFKNFDVLAIQESHGDSKTIRDWPRKLGFENGVFSIANSKAKGAGILWKQDFTELGRATDKQGRIAGAAIQSESETILIISAYAPTLDASFAKQDEYIKFLISLKAIIDDLKTKFMAKHIIIAGDFNIMFNKNIDSFSQNPKIYSIPKEQLSDILHENNLHDGFRAMNGNVRAYTYAPMGKNIHKTFNRLDYIFITPEIMENSHSCQHIYVPHTDHKAVIMNKKEDTQKELLGIWKHNDTWNKNQDFTDGAKAVIEKAIAETRESSSQAQYEWIKHKLKRYSISMSVAKLKQEKESKKECLDIIESSDPTIKHEEITEAKKILNAITAAENERTIFRSKVEFREHGEKCTKYFFALINQNRAQSNIYELETQDGLKKEKQDIQEEIYNYFKDLFTQEQKTEEGNTEAWYNLLPKISDEEKKELEKEFTMNEIYNIVFKKMHQGKSPGNDGLTLGLYQVLWSHLKDPLLKSLREARIKGQMSNSQKQSIIRLIQKKDKDPKQLKNWRPISLLNVDTKIYAKIYAERFKKLLHKLISTEQLAFMKGKQIQDGIRLIDQVIETLENNSSNKGSVLAIDLQKAFDSIEHKHLWKVLESMNISQDTIKAIHTLYKGAESAVINQGTTTRYFPIEKSCRQGDPLSPYLFLFAIEPLIRRLKSTMTGVNTKMGRAILSFFADDGTTFPKDMDEKVQIIQTLTDFHKISGLKINEEKSEILQLGDWKEGQIRNEKIKVVKMIKITGAYLGLKCVKAEIEKANFEPVISGIEKKFNLWRMRNLSLPGKILIIKAHGLSKLQFLASAIPVPDSATEQIDKLIQAFLWNGRAKVAKTIMAKEWSKGGMGLPLTKDVVAAAAIQWLRRACLNPSNLWAQNIIESFNHIGGMNAGSYDYAKTELKNTKDIPDFTKYLVAKWESIVGEDKIKTLDENSPIWLNKKLKTKRLKGRTGKVLKSDRLAKQGISVIKDLFHPAGGIITGKKALQMHLPKNAVCEWNKIILVLPKEVRSMKITGTKHTLQPRPDNLPIMPTTLPILKKGEHTLNTNELTQKNILKLISRSRSTHDRPYKIEVTNKYGFEEDEWCKIFKYATRHSNVPKQREFIFKLNHKLLGTNKSFYEVGYKNSPKCTYCLEEVQTFYHLFNECEEVNCFKDIVTTKILNKQNMTNKDWLFGAIQNETLQDRANIFIATETLRYIYKRNWKHEPLSLDQLKAIIRQEEKLEHAIAEKNNKTLKHLQKWEHILLKLQ